MSIFVSSNCGLAVGFPRVVCPARSVGRCADTGRPPAGPPSSAGRAPGRTADRLPLAAVPRAVTAGRAPSALPAR